MSSKLNKSTHENNRQTTQNSIVYSPEFNSFMDHKSILTMNSEVTNLSQLEDKLESYKETVILEQKKIQDVERKAHENLQIA